MMQRLCRHHSSNCCSSSVTSRLPRKHCQVHQIVRFRTCDPMCRQHQKIRPLKAAASSQDTAATATTAAAREAARIMTVYFREEDVSTSAAAGDNLTEVAAAAAVTIPTGCWQGNCGVCEVEVYKYTGNADHDKAAAASPAVVRACVTKLPPGYSRIEVAQMQDAIWGLDGYDT